MDINSLAQNILTFMIGTVSVSAVIIAVSKRVFDRWLQTRVIKYDYELKFKIEEYKLEKEKIAEESKIRFSKLHSERAEIIKELYKKLVRMHDFLIVYFDEYNTNNTDSNKFLTMESLMDEATTDFLNFSNDNRIYFDTKLASTIKQIEDIVVLKLDIRKYKVSVTENNKTKLSDSESRFINQLIHEEIPCLKELLEQEFRKILGVN
jgi:hypothetical protein